jgi:glycosyltransferase involved in cell wall biosynthesis
LKVLQICAAYKPAFIYGGPTMSVAALSEQLAAAGIITQAYATTANGKEELPVSPGKTVAVDGVSVTYFKRITGDHTHFSPALICRLWKEAKNFDLVHIHAWWNTVSIFSCMVALMRGVPVILSPRGTLSGYSFRNRNGSVKWLIHQLLSKPLLKRCHFHATSQQEADAISESFKPLSITVIANFVAVPAVPSTKPQQKSVKFRLAFLSRIEEKKGLDLLINSLPLLNIPYTLTIAGDGRKEYIEELKELSIANGTDPNVNWIGFLGNEKFEFLAGQDLLVLPSHNENFANVVVEALAEGTPVLVSDFVGLSDYVKKKEFGWTCPLNAAAIAQTVNMIAKQQKKLELIRSSAPAEVRADFGAETLLGHYIEMYQNIIAK